MSHAELYAGTYLVHIEVEDERIIVDYLATYPRRLGTVVIDRLADGEEDDAQLAMLEEWCDQQTVVWICTDANGHVTVTDQSAAVERILP